MRRTLSILGGVVVGIGLSQFPEYAQQYTQRLGGAVDELRIITEEFEQAATQSGLTRDDAIDRFASTGDTFIEGRGVSMERTFARYEMLKETLAEIQGAAGWERFTLLPRYLDTEIGARALDNFRPAIPVTMEGFAYAGAGFLAGYLVTSGLVRFLMLTFRRRRYRETVQTEAPLLTPVSPPPSPRTEPPMLRLVPEFQPEAPPIEPETRPIANPESRLSPDPAQRPPPQPSETVLDEAFVHPAVAAARRRHQGIATG